MAFSSENHVFLAIFARNFYLIVRTPSHEWHFYQPLVLESKVQEKRKKRKGEEEEKEEEEEEEEEEVTAQVQKTT